MAVSRITDEKIIQGCLQNDRRSQRLLYDQFSPTMLGLCMRYANCKDEAEDIMIEGFLRVFQKLDTYKGESSLEYWIRRIMVNSAISYYRKHGKHYKNNSIDDTFERDVLDVNATIDDTISVKELMILIQEMPDYLRVILNLRSFEGYEYADIAKELDIEEVSCRSRFSKARKWLEERLNPKF